MDIATMDVAWWSAIQACAQRYQKVNERGVRSAGYILIYLFKNEIIVSPSSDAIKKDVLFHFQNLN